MKSSFIIGKIKGIIIEVNISWFIIFFIVTYSLATSYFPVLYPDFSISTNWLLGCIITVFYFVSVLLHELSHSLVSKRLGIPVNKITLFIFGGIARLDREPDSPGDEFKISIAGPAMSLALFALFMLLEKILNRFGASQVVVVTLSYLSSVNLLLAIFNLIPAFPMDGGRVLRSIIWRVTGDLQKATKYSSSMGTLFGNIFIVLGVILVFNGSLLSGIWLAFIGWFIIQLSLSNYQTMLITNIFDKIYIREFMTSNVTTVDYSISVQELIENYFYKYKFIIFPVKRNDEIIGVVRIETVKALDKELRAQTTVGSITIPINPDLTVSPGDNVSKAMTKLFKNDIGRVLVMDQGNLIGIISSTDILKYLNIYKKLNK